MKNLPKNNYSGKIENNTKTILILILTQKIQIHQKNNRSPLNSSKKEPTILMIVIIGESILHIRKEQSS